MIGILLVTHGRLAEELKAAALIIQPEISSIVAVALEWSEIGEDARERIAAGLAQADSGDGAVILTDMFGGTPTNLTPLLSEEGPRRDRHRRQPPDGAQVRFAPGERQAGRRGRAPRPGPGAALDLRRLGPARERGIRLGRRVGDAGPMIERELAIRNRLGLHARAAAKFVQTASRFKSAVKIRKNGEEVDGKSILGILLLAASQGTRIVLTVTGEDEHDAFAAVEDLIARSFDEEE
jgi:phosphocarrier protein